MLLVHNIGKEELRLISKKALGRIYVKRRPLPLQRSRICPSAAASSGKTSAVRRRAQLGACRKRLQESSQVAQNKAALAGASRQFMCAGVLKATVKERAL